MCCAGVLQPDSQASPLKQIVSARIAELRNEKRVLQQQSKAKTNQIRNEKRKNDRLVAAARKLSPQQLLQMAADLTSAAAQNGGNDAAAQNDGNDAAANEAR